MTQIMNTGLLLAPFAIPVIGDECSAGSLAGLQNETCDIRNSEDQLRAGGGAVSSYDNAGLQPAPPR